MAKIKIKEKYRKDGKSAIHRLRYIQTSRGKLL